MQYLKEHFDVQANLKIATCIRRFVFVCEHVCVLVVKYFAQHLNDQLDAQVLASTFAYSYSRVRERWYVKHCTDHLNKNLNVRACLSIIVKPNCLSSTASA